MAYFVTHNTAPGAIDIGRGAGFNLEQALAHARQMLIEGRVNVAIQDGNGRSVSGPDLVACCKGEKTLTADLRVS